MRLMWASYNSSVETEEESNDVDESFPFVADIVAWHPHTRAVQF